MNEMLIAVTPVALWDLDLLVDRQQDQISDLEEQLSALALGYPLCGAAPAGPGGSWRANAHKRGAWT